MAKTKWVADPAHSEVQFRVRHLMITTVTGYFRSFNVEVETEDADFTKASKILFTAAINSIDTNNAQRDTHLKSGDFFEVEKYPEIRFVGKKLEKKDENNYQLNGELTIRDITKTVTVDIEYGGTVVDPYGQIKAGFTVTGKIKRKDFGLMWDAATEAGQVVVANEIKLHAEIQLIKQQEPTKTEAKATEEAEVS